MKNILRRRKATNEENGRGRKKSRDAGREMKTCLQLRPKRRLRIDETDTGTLFQMARDYVQGQRGSWC